MILFPVEIDHLNIVTKTYYFYLDTVSGTKSLWDLTLTKFSESNYSLCCFPLSFRKSHDVRSHLRNTFENFFVISTVVDFATANFSSRTVAFPVPNLQKAIAGSSHQRCSIKKVFLKNSQNSQENTSQKIHRTPPETCYFIKKETLAQLFSCEFWEISKNTFFTEYLYEAASE